MQGNPGVKRLAAALLASALLLPGAVPAAGVQSVLIVSLDALHPAALGPETTPVICRLMQMGAFTLDGRSTRPPLTLVSHAAMMSGRGPGEGGREDNHWQAGDPVIPFRTLFEDAKAGGFVTGFFYSKEKLGYLVTKGVDRHRLDREFSVENAGAFFRETEGRRFCVVHVSGLDRAGPSAGWLSREYLEELRYLDESLEPLVDAVTAGGRYLILVTSDHAGHGKIHGSDHPDDGKLPLVMASDTLTLSGYQGIPYQVSSLRALVNEMVFGRQLP